MENASKALIMAASVLLGVMILSLGVFLFKTFGDYSANATQKMNEKEISEFNNQFFKYQTGSDGQIAVSKVHDLITCANLAKENNQKYEYPASETRKSSNYYIQVSVPGYINFEKQSEQVYIQYIKNNLYDSKGKIKEYVCQRIETNANNKKVNYISFSEKR